MVVRLFLVLLLVAPAFASAPSVAAAPRTKPFPHLPARGALQVGVATDSYPYSYRDGLGQPQGFTVDLLDAVARVMNLPLLRIADNGQALQQRFADGEFDMLQSLSQTAGREAYAEFTVPFLDLQGAIFIRKGDPGLRTVQDLGGKKIAVIGRHSIGEEFFRAHGLTIDPVYISSTSEGLALVRSGTCSGVFASRLTALSVLERHGWKDLAQFGEPLANYDIRHCFAVHRGDAELLARLNEGLAVLHRNGEFDRIHQRWFGRFTAPLISRAVVSRIALAVLALALLAAVAVALHQRRLHRRLAQQAAELARQQTLLHALYDNIPLAIVVLEVEPAGERVLTINRSAEAVCGVLAADAAGRLLRDLPLQPEWRTHLESLLTRGRDATQLLREERALGASRRRLVFSLVPMGSAAPGRPRHCILIEDITERRSLDEEISQSRRLRAVGELVGGIAHEFNNLLTPVTLQVGMIQLEWAHDSRLLEEVRIIADVTHRAAELTRRLLTFGRKNDLQIAPIQLAAAVHSCFALLRLTVDRRIVWEQAIPANLPPLQFNVTDLNQIILNLVINARDTLLDKLARQPGEWTPMIRLEAELLPADALGRLEGLPSRRQILGWQRLTVRDNGLGMSAEVRERIFEPFYTTKDVGKGTGLGLATVWHLVTEASGRIEVDSTPNEGSAFHVYLPMLPAVSARAAAAEHAIRREVGPGRIFLAEDDPLVAQAILGALHRDGHTVSHRPDGAVAWQDLQTQPDAYDVLILDVNMPGLDGIELAQRIRGLGTYRGRMMIISGRLSSNELRQIVAAGIDCVLNKPFEVAELIGAVRDCLRAGSR